MDRDFTKKVLVTGAAGYIGSELVRNLLHEGFQVAAFDNLTFGGEALLGVWGHPRFRFIKGDLLHDDDVRRALAGVHYVCHLAAIVGEPPCKKYPELARKVNRDASVRLYELAEEAKVEKFVFASTCSNYGKMADSSRMLTENDELNPISLYSETKVDFEQYLLGIQSSDVTRTILRFSTVYGASPRLRFDLTVNEFTREAVLNKPLLIYGEHFWRPYCHVADLANSVKTALVSDRQLTHNQAFNVGDTGQNFTKKMLMDEIRKVVPALQVEYQPVASDPRDYKVNCDKIRDVLGFKLSKTVPEGIREIASLVGNGIISDPYSAAYRNI